MSENHTETRNGITVTVWLSPFSVYQWLVIATKNGKLIKIPPITASNRTDAANRAFELAEEQLC